MIGKAKEWIKDNLNLEVFVLELLVCADAAAFLGGFVCAIACKTFAGFLLWIPAAIIFAFIAAWSEP